MIVARLFFSFFFFNDTATTEIYTLSLHDALPISIEKFFPSGQAFVVPLQNFVRSARVTSFTLLLAEVTIAIFLNAASADTAHMAATQAIASARHNFAEILACMNDFVLSKVIYEVFLSPAAAASKRYALLAVVSYLALHVGNAHTCTSDQLF